MKQFLFLVCFVALLLTVGVVWNYLNPFTNVWLRFVWTLSSGLIGYAIGSYSHKIFPWFYNE